jgi:uncharacterized SAM-binding protein YcdF (DUF218 family)
VSDIWAVGGAEAPSLDPHPTPVGGAPVVGPPAPRRRWLRRTVWTVLLVTLAGGVYFGITWLQVRATGRSDQARDVDAIVVMGAAQYDGRPSPLLQARLDHVVELWNRGLAPVVVVTGGNQPGDRFTEASASAAYLVEHGVPTEAILQETFGQNSFDSLEGVADILGRRGLDRVVLVSDPFHSLRIKLTAEELGLEAYVSPTRTSPLHGAESLRRELKEAAGVSVGRFIGFRRLVGITG